MTGDRATELFQCLMRAQLSQRVRHPSYRLETWSMPPEDIDLDA
jgi:hypothetical protein